MIFNTIQFQKVSPGIGLITLNRPKRKNAISIEMRREISSCLSILKESEDIYSVIFTGSGNIFSAGFDLNEFDQPDLFEELFDSSSRYHREVWNFPKPTIAAVNGPAMGGAFDLATLCDIRVCSNIALFGHPEIKFGAPPVFTPLRWIVGSGLARDLCMTGRRIDAQEAFRIGLVSEVVSSEELISRATQIANSILESPVDALQFTKSYFTSNEGRGFEESFYIEHDKAFQEVLLRKAKQGLKR